MKKDALAIVLGMLVFAATFVFSMYLVYAEVPVSAELFYAPPFLIASMTVYYYAARRRFLSSLLLAFPAAIIATSELAVVLWAMAGSPPGKLTAASIADVSLSALPWYLMYSLVVCAVGSCIALLIARQSHNKRLQPIGRFLRFSGHPELTIQECHRWQDPDPERHTNTAIDSKRQRFD